jgi:hypothetical protein
MARGRSLAAALTGVVTAAVVAGCGLSLGGSGAAGGRSAPARTVTVGVAPVAGARTGSAGANAGAAGANAGAAGANAGAARIRATVARAQRTHEIPTPAPSQTALGGWRSPVQAVQVFAQWYINWTAGTVATHLHVLSRLAVGQARSAMTLAAGQAGRDSSIKLGGIANSGTVEAIAPVTGERNVYAVVTRERTTATNTNAYQGLRAAWHVTLATVTEVAGRLWTISGWQPEN